MGTKSKCEIHLSFICCLWIYRFYLGYKNKLSVEFNYNFKLSIEFIYKYLHLYSIVFMLVCKMFQILEFLDFRISDKGYPTCRKSLHVLAK
jgi:hypothetical protein